MVTNLSLTEGVPQHAARDSGDESLILHGRDACHTPPMRPVEVELDATLDGQRSTKDKENQSVEDNGDDGTQEQLSIFTLN